jgi:hypothetical protein
MSNPITTLTFRLVPIKGEIGTATGSNNTGFVGQSFYYEIIQGAAFPAVGVLAPVTNSASGRVIGVIAYDYFQARWSVLFTVDNAMAPNDPTTYVNDNLAITSFLATIAQGNYPQPMTQDAQGDLLPYQASLPPIKS